MRPPPRLFRGVYQSGRDLPRHSHRRAEERRPYNAAVAGAAIEARPASPAEPRRDDTAQPASPRHVDWAPLIAVVAFVGGLALYGLTAAPGVQGGDSGEFQFVGYVLGIPHPPGYPLYAIVSKLWTLAVPVGEVAR